MPAVEGSRIIPSTHCLRVGHQKQSMVLGKNIAGNSKEDFTKKAIALVASRLMQLPVVCMEYTGLSAD